jgi:DNA modification methylase
MIDLRLGDCLEVMKTIPNDSILITDPPYNQSYHYSGYGDNLSEDEYKELLCAVFMNRKSVIIHYPEETINLLSYIGKCEQAISWFYNSNTAKQHRLITWWNCKPNMRAVGQDYKNPTDKRIAKRISEGKTARLYDWWEINQVKNVSKKDNPHPCPIPEELARRIILLSTKEGDTVVDPFMGSGTFGVACKKLNRNFIGIEISPEYFKIAERRINNTTENLL